MQRALVMDLGSSFEAEVEQSERSTKATISRCLYHKVLAAEGVPHLVQVCCCSQDAVWFEGLEKSGLSYERRAWKGAGDACCVLRVSQTT